MNIKLHTLINSAESLKKLIAIKIPIKIGYQLSKLVNQIQPDLSSYEENRVKLVKEYGILDEKGDLKVSNDNIQKFTEELTKLTEIDVNVDFEKIKVEDLGQINIEPQELVHLGWLLE